MLTTSLPDTHYWPHDGDEQHAVCGTPMRDDARRHSLQPTCAVCAAYLATLDDAIDAAVEAMPWPLDADEARELVRGGGR